MKMKLEVEYYMIYKIKNEHFVDPKQVNIPKTTLYLPNSFVNSLATQQIRKVCKDRILFNKLFIYEHSSSYITFAIEDDKLLVLMTGLIINERDKDDV
jgi:hypothetical protein